jgi:hypothetical protein
MTQPVEDLHRRCPECGAHNRSDVDPCWLCGYVAAPPKAEAPTRAPEPGTPSPSVPAAGDSADVEGVIMPSFELLRYESGPPLTTAGRVLLMAIVGLFVVVGLGLFLPLGLKMTVVYLLVAGIPAAFVMRMIWTRQR